MLYEEGITMNYVRLKVEPEVIIDAIEKSHRNLDDVKERFKTLDKWINKELDPTFNQLKELSGFLRIPFGYLLLKKPAQEQISLLKFRTIDTDAIEHPSRELIDTIKDMERKQAWLRGTFITLKREPLKFVGSLEMEQDRDPVQIANHIRNVINLKKRWYEKASSSQPTFTILRKKLSEQGITVMQNGIALNNTHRPLELNEFRAFTLIDAYAPLVFINSKDSNNGKTFSLLHELVHIFFGRHSLYNDDLKFRNKYTNPLEITCNSVAGELIAPTDLFIAHWEQIYQDVRQEDEKISLIAKDFRVSQLVIARKALDQNYIEQQTYNQIAQSALKQFKLHEKRKDNSNGGHPVNNALSRLDHNFLGTLMTSVESGDIQYTYAYRLAGVGRGVFEEIADRLKGIR